MASWLWESRTQFRDDDKCEPNHDEEKGKELTAGEPAIERRIRFAKIFDDDAEDRVADKKQTGQNAVRLRIRVRTIQRIEK